MTYAEFVKSRTKPLESPLLDLLHMSVGCSGESGELLDAVKKSWIYNKPLDTVNVIEELGDLLFYIQGALNAVNHPTIKTLDDLCMVNKVKLTTRYPTGYSDKAAQERADKK